MKIRELMTHHTKCVHTSDTAYEAVRVMEDYNVGAVPVVERGAVIGMITDRDICFSAFRRNKRLDEMTIASCMTPSPAICRQDDDASVARTLMKRHHVHRLPVVDAKKRLVGIVSVTDLARHAGLLEPSDVVDVMSGVGATPIATPS